MAKKEKANLVPKEEMQKLLALENFKIQFNGKVFEGFEGKEIKEFPKQLLSSFARAKMIKLS